MTDQRLEIAVSALEEIPPYLRCTCPQEMLQAGLKHFQDCPMHGWREHIRRVILSYAKGLER